MKISLDNTTIKILISSLILDLIIYYSIFSIVNGYTLFLRMDSLIIVYQVNQYYTSNIQSK